VLSGSHEPVAEEQKKDYTMKRFVLASVAALALTLACQQTASANGGWSLHLSGSLSLSGSWSCCTPPCGPGYYYSYGAPQYYYASPASYPDYAPAHAAAPAPAAQPQGPAVTVQQTGYYYYGNYGFYQVPSYWYGR
jgi:hypothetical protein